MDKRKVLYVPVDKETHKRVTLATIDREMYQKDWVLEAIKEKLEREVEKEAEVAR